jgi:uncharacterized membrane protein
MGLRSSLIDTAAVHGLDGPDLKRLLALGDVESEPQGMPRQAPRILAALAALMFGLGVIFWVAANWGEMQRTGKFAVLQGLVLLAGAIAIFKPGLIRAPMALLAMLGMGGLFAFFGQTYQTGADAWQLFALWAALALPLALAARSDLVWLPWVIVAMTAVTLWAHAAIGRVWRFDAHDADVQAIACLGAALVVLLVGRRLRRFTGAGLWSLRMAAWLFASMVTLLGAFALLHQQVAPQYWVSMLVIVGACAWFASRSGYDLMALSAAALGLNVLVVAGLARLLMDGFRSGVIGSLLTLGLIAAGALACTVSLLMKRVRLEDADDASSPNPSSITRPDVKERV